MLSLLKIKNVALIDSLTVEFSGGLNLLTGETGSGKSIIVDSLGALTGTRVSVDLIKEGEERASIEGIFRLEPSKELAAVLDGSGIEYEANGPSEIIVRREIAGRGKNRVFVNDHAVTQGLLREIGSSLADIHGQGEQATLFNPAHHIDILDSFGDLESEVDAVRTAYEKLRSLSAELRELEEDDSQKLQLLDILRFQTEEILRAGVEEGEDDRLEEEKNKLTNVERISALSDESYGLLYEDEKSIVAGIDRTARLIDELGEFESSFGEYAEGIETAKAVLEDLAIQVRDFRNSIEYSPERLEEIENRLAEIGALKRKYGGSLEAVLNHFEESQKRLENIETAEQRGEALRNEISKAEKKFLEKARKLSSKRTTAARKFEKRVGDQFASVALEKARFEVRIEENPQDRWSEKGIDEVEFYFSANPGESPRPVAKVASGGEASRLMLLLKTAAGLGGDDKAVVFDEIDAGIGGRVADAVGIKLKHLADKQQILCVTHQPQVASRADVHFVVEKDDDGSSTRVTVRRLNDEERLEEIARMLAGEEITDAARENARSMLSAKAARR